MAMTDAQFVEIISGLKLISTMLFIITLIVVAEFMRRK